MIDFSSTKRWLRRAVVALQSVVSATFLVLLVTAVIFVVAGAVAPKTEAWQAIIMPIVLIGPLLVDWAAWKFSVRDNGTLQDRIAVLGSAAWTASIMALTVAAGQVDLNRLQDVLAAFLMTGRIAFTMNTIRAWITSWREPQQQDSAAEREAKRLQAAQTRENNREAVRQRAQDRYRAPKLPEK